MAEKEYLIEISGNEPLLERYISAIENNNCKADATSYCAYSIDASPSFLNSSVVEYFFQIKSFNLEIYQDFFEKLRKIDASGFGGFSYDLKNWIRENVIKKYYEITNENEGFFELYPTKPFRNKIQFDNQDLDKLKFICYVATCYMKFGASYESVTANEYFEIVNELDAEVFQQFKQNGSQQFDKQLTFFQDKDLLCQANDAFATIAISAKNDHEETYCKALNFINNLLKMDFPRSFSIEFVSPHQQALNIENLQLCGQNYLFSGAVKYPQLHPQIIEYINLSLKEHEWYSNLEAEDCAIPSTFAVFALAIKDRKYLNVLEQYLNVVDDGHQSIQQHFTVAFVKKYGIDQQTFPLFLKLIRSMQEHPSNPDYIQHFQKAQNLQFLLDAKPHFDDWEWSYVLYSIFGKDSDSDLLAVKFCPELWQVYLKIREKRAEDL
ncbi:DUF6138 family protein [Acinetobacter sp. WCHAc060025]|uniref:DUF6138 family protein n=1 Tax=Acinetobacter sp. WCHAc060025 TaxID=2518625 RepID=UPI001022A3E0|nr:DUF6138 family protein [Acinetobacter sp. WCHAc060025]RZG77836.1 hypothetical protein EXE09_02655 [Acinetobacter sp. WCHAc060025]